MKKTIVVWFSCGAASAVAARKTVDLYANTHNIRVVNNPILEEHPDNLRFKQDIQDWIGVEIESAINPKWENYSIVEVWEKKKAMSFIHGAPCTLELKKKARQHWESNNDFDAMVLGFTADECDRHDKLSQVEPVPIIPVLIDLGLTKADCFDFLRRNKIKLPEIYDLGFPNANCIGCSKATSPEYWNLVRKKFPKIFEERAKQSRELGVKLVRQNGERVMLDKLHPQAKGRRLKAVQPYQCSLFCDL